MRRLIMLLSVILIISGNNLIHGQSRSINRDKYRIHINQTSEKINIDGILDENSWMTAECTGKFQRVTPTESTYEHGFLNLYLSRVAP